MQQFTASAPAGFRQKTKILYKESIIVKIMGTSACLALTAFLMAIIYYTVLLERSAETTLFDCGGGSCRDLYKEKSGCDWGTLYSDSFKFTQHDHDDHNNGVNQDQNQDQNNQDHQNQDQNQDQNNQDHQNQDDQNQDHSDENNGRRRLVHKIRGADNFSVADKESLENLAVHGGMRRILADDGCEPKDKGNYWVIAGQHYAAGPSIENILVQLKHAGDDMWSIINLSWTAATLTWTLSSVAFSLLLPWCGDSLLHPEIAKELQLEGNNDVEMATNSPAE